jgi:hypothetical protein
MTVRYVLDDWAGPVGVYTVTRELARDLRRLSFLPNADIDLDYTIYKFVDGKCNPKADAILPSVMMEMYPDAVL